VLKRSTDPTATVLGSAIVRTSGPTVYFVAKLAGGTEIRGEGTQNSAKLAEAINIGARDPDGTIIRALGFAQMQATGELICSGMFGEQDYTADAVAIPIPADLTTIPEPIQDEAPSEALIDPIEAVDEAAAEAAPAQP